MRMSAPAVDPRVDPSKDGGQLPLGAQVYRNGKPITIVFDNGVFYEWVEGHQYREASNDRSGLSKKEDA